MCQNFLLTGTINGTRDFLWFECESDLLEFIDSNDVTDYEAIEILNWRDIEINE